MGQRFLMLPVKVTGLDPLELIYTVLMPSSPKFVGRLIQVN